VKVLHVITDLGQGGAEAVLCRLIAASPENIVQDVVSLRGMGYYGSRLRARGVAVQTLDMGRGHLPLAGAWTLRRLIAEAAPDVVQTWMYHADLLGGLAARWVGLPVVWGIRHADLDASRNSLSARLAARTCAVLSDRVPAAIACCSRRAKAVHQALGYRADRFVLIANGYDLTRYDIDPMARRRLREALGMLADTPLLGMVARWNPHKDHANLLAALARLKVTGHAFRCVLVGEGMAADNATLCGWIERFGLTDRVVLAGPRDDVPEVMNALDVGDAADIVGGTGWIVPPGDAGALAAGIAEALDALARHGRDALGARCRARIQVEFGLQRMVAAYVALWRSVARRSRGWG
jgi:glycosyltransferase involved in cell wall biosynthesis